MNFFNVFFLNKRSKSSNTGRGIHVVLKSTVGESCPLKACMSYVVGGAMGGFMGLFQVNSSVILKWKLHINDKKTVRTDLAVEYRPSPSYTHHDYTRDSNRYAR